METASHVLFAISRGLSQLMEPAMYGLQRLDAAIRVQLRDLHVPFEWQSTIITAVWVIGLVLLVRWLEGWPRLVAVVLIGLVLAKMYGVLPPV
jgi:hypothetical protein